MPGRSTLMTSAPRSARICPAQGAARMRLRSSTLTWDRGPVFGFIGGPFRTGYALIETLCAGPAVAYPMVGKAGMRRWAYRPGLPHAAYLRCGHVTCVTPWRQGDWILDHE